MKFKWILSATLALTVSSTAMASSGLGQELGRINNPIASQCTLVDKPQAESKSDRSKDDSDRDSGRRDDNGEAV